MPEKPEPIEISPEELESLIERVEAGELQAGDSEIIRAMAEIIAYLSQAVEQKNVSMRRILNTLFGSQSEKLEKVLEKAGHSLEEKDSPAPSEKPEKKKPKGHGRNSADRYHGAERIEVSHPDLASGDPCPSAQCKGKVYPLRVPSVAVRVRGAAPLAAKVIRREQLRCNLCLEIFTAPMPEGHGEQKYDETSASMIALLKYGSGLPFNRLEKLQQNLGMPLPASTQWDIALETATKLQPVYGELLRQAAEGDLLHNDDTTARILSEMGKRKEKNGNGSSSEKAEGRSGIFTTGIVSVRDGRKIALFFTGKKHAGENLEDLLKLRAASLPVPIQMCDALSRNTKGEFETHQSNCMSHGRRQFVDVAENFPRECRRILEAIGEIYHYDAIARERGLVGEERLEFHREHSRRVMVELRLWFRQVFLDREVEPNSSLGKAIGYMKKHWRKLTLFYRRAGAPLDNNLCERALKKAIQHRKNALFFRSRRGAAVGDLFMSLVHSTELAGENPFEYLNEVQRHLEPATQSPADWMPWTFRETLARLQEADPA